MGKLKRKDSTWPTLCPILRIFHGINSFLKVIFRMTIPYLWGHGADLFQNGSFSPIIFKNIILLTSLLNALITPGHRVLVGRLRSVKAELDESNKGGDTGQQHS